MEHNDTQREVKHWLLLRGISEDVLKENQISWDDQYQRIVIPVLDSHGIFHFNKYRRNPLVESNEPKYRYDKGATSILYNTHKKLTSPVFIVEGELECLRFNSMELSAVSSTGGAGTFKKEWVKYLEGLDVFICMDADEAGVKGAIKIQQMLPAAKWVAIPPHIAKDPTEFMQATGEEEFMKLVMTAESYDIPQDYDLTIIDKKEILALKRAFGDAANKIVDKQRIDGGRHLDIIRYFLLSRMGYYSGLLGKIGRDSAPRLDLESVRRTPITEFLAFNRAGYAKCLWHNEKEESLKYYGDDAKYPNTVHCFGACQRSYDVIDVVQKLHNCSFIEAVNRLKT